MSEILIFEPSLCCESGICGATIDKELLRVTGMVKKLQNEGYNIKRYNLSSHPMEFISNKLVNDFLLNNDIKKLPITVVNNKIVKIGTYPTNDEIYNFLNIFVRKLNK